MERVRRMVKGTLKNCCLVKAKQREIKMRYCYLTD
jgi:hypothetical protein